MIRTGINAIEAAAISSDQLVEYSPWNEAIISGTVNFTCEFRKTGGPRKSFQLPMNVKIATELTGGLDSGTMMRRRLPRVAAVDAGGVLQAAGIVM